jgi:hypothetical protein
VDPSGCLIHLTDDCRFGWVNASYMYGLQIVDAHCQRALGTLSTWEQLFRQRATLYEDKDAPYEY